MNIEFSDLADLIPNDRMLETAGIEAGFHLRGRDAYWTLEIIGPRDSYFDEVSSISHTDRIMMVFSYVGVIWRYISINGKNRDIRNVARRKMYICNQVCHKELNRRNGIDE